MTFNLDFPFALGSSNATASFRHVPEDFQVDEYLGFEPEGDGEHIYLHIRKRGTNTEWLADQLARLVDIRPSDVGYCGLKDRHAETTQWFSLYLPGRNGPDWGDLAAKVNADVQVLVETRGQRKLRRGQHLCNRFAIRLRNVQANADELSARLKLIRERGVPNYFGEQRFGRDGQNLVLANGWLGEGRPIRARPQKNRAMSAARSYLFNLVVAARVSDGSWSTEIAGDVMDAGPWPTAPLWGRGRSTTGDVAAEIEATALTDMGSWLNGLEHCGLSQERRTMVLMPQNLEWTLQEDILELRFDLAPGQFATSVLREIALLQNVSAGSSPV